MEPTNQNTAPQAPVQNSSASNDTVLAAVATIPLVGLILYFAMPQVSAFVRHYEKQGTALFATYILVFIVNTIVNIIDLPFISGLIGLALLLVNLALLIGWILLLVNAIQNKIFRLPLISDLADQYLK